MSFYGDYHTHTSASDGKGSMCDIIQAALARGLAEVAISDHGFSSPRIGALTIAKFKKQQEQLPALRDKYPKINILHSIEANILNYEGTLDIPMETRGELDILLAGFHLSAKPGFRDWYNFIYKGFRSKILKPSKEQIRRNTQALTNAVKHNEIDILAHPNSVLKTNIKDVAQACADYGTFFEVNVKHLDSLIPLLDDILATDVTLIANSDAHIPDRVGMFAKVQSFFVAHNIDLSRVANWERKPVFRSQQRRG